MPITLSTARSASTDGFENFLAARALPANDVESGEQPLTLIHYLRQIHNFGARQHFMRGEIIFSQGGAPAFVYRVVSGMVRLARTMPDGRRHIADFLNPGELMGFTENSGQPFSAEAVTEVTLTAFPRICFEQLARENPGIRAQLLRAASPLSPVPSGGARERTAAFLLRLAESQELARDERLDLAMPRQDIADHLGLTIEAIARALSALRGEGLILLPNATQIVLRDPAGLRLAAAQA